MLNKDDIEKLHGVMLPDSENWKEQSLISSTPAGKAEMTRTEAFHNRALNGDEDCAPLIDVRTGGIDYRTAYELALEEMEVMERELAQMAKRVSELEKENAELSINPDIAEYSKLLEEKMALEAKLAAWEQVWDNVQKDVPDLRSDNKPLAVAATYELQRTALAEAGRDAERWKRMYECAQNANSFRQDAIDGL